MRSRCWPRSRSAERPWRAPSRAAGATIERVETDADGNAAYEAHMVKADGTRVTVFVDRDFEVVGTEEGHGGPRRDDQDSAA